MACGPHRKKQTAPPFSFCQHSLHTSHANWNIGIKWMENHSDQNADPIFVSRSAGSKWASAHLKGTWERSQDAGPREDAANHSKHQLAGKLTTNTYAWGRFSGWNEQNMRMKQIITSIYMQGEETHIEKMAHCNQYFCCLYRTVYNKKRSIYKNQYPLSHVNLTFFFSSHLKRSKNILFFSGKSGWETLIFSFFKSFLIFFLSTPNPIWTSHCLGVASQAVVVS